MLENETCTNQSTHGGLVSITQSIQGLKMKRGIKAGIYGQDGIKETHFQKAPQP